MFGVVHLGKAKLSNRPATGKEAVLLKNGLAIQGHTDVSC